MKTDRATIDQLELPVHLTSTQCRAAIHQYHAKQGIDEWVLFDEFNPFTGVGISRIDIFAIDCWQSANRGAYNTVAYEIKVSRSDFLLEVRRPLKRRLALLWSNYFSFVCPVGLLGVKEIPVECGLLEIMPDLTLKHSKSAPYRDRMPPSWALAASLARRAIRQERASP